MSTKTYLYRFLMSNFLTLYYSCLALIIIAVKFLKNPFRNPWTQKLRLVPPSELTNPKYGTHKYIKVNNIKLHYVESGDPSKPLMLFLHGFPEFWYSWRHQIVEFNKDYWCIAVDMRGYADSEKPEDVKSYDLELLVEDVRDLIRQLGREKFILVAHDWGGLIACKFRDMHPETLMALVVIASASMDSWLKLVWGGTEQKKKSWYVFLIRLPYLMESLLQMNDMEVLDEMMPKNEDKYTDQDVECYKYWFGKQCALTPPLNYYRANFHFVVPKKQRCEKNIPFLLAAPEKDSFISVETVKSMKEEYAHLETFILDGCRHFCQHEEPTKVNATIREFLTKHNIS